MVRGITLVRQPNQVISDDYLKIVLKEPPSFIGYAVRGVKEGQPVLMSEVTTDGANMTLAAIGEFMEGCKALPTMMHLGWSNDAWKEEDIQPFPVVNEGVETKLFACLTGGFEDFAGDHSNEFHAMEKFVRPFCLKQWNGSGKDFNKLCAELKDPVNQQALMSAIGSAGTITFLGIDGNGWAMQKNNQNAGSFKWGFTSNRAGYDEAPAVVEVPKISKMGMGIAALAAGAAVVAGLAGGKQEEKPIKTSVAEPSPTPPAEVPKEQEGAGVVLPSLGKKDKGATLGEIETKLMSSTSGSEYISVAPDKKLEGKALKQWYRFGLNLKTHQPPPDGWQNHIAIHVHRNRISQLKNFRLVDGNAKIEDAVRAADKEKLNGGRPIASVEPVKQQGPASPIPIVSPQAKEKVEEVLTNTNTATAVEAFKLIAGNPEEFAKYEKRHPTFAQVFGVGELQDTKNYPFEVLVNIGKEDPGALALYAMNWRSEALRTQQRSRPAEAVKEEKAEVVQPKPATTTSSGLPVMRSRRVA